jgi:hypothetical protein
MTPGFTFSTHYVTVISNFALGQIAWASTNVGRAYGRQKSSPMQYLRSGLQAFRMLLNIADT